MKKAKSTKAIDIKTMQPVTLKPAKKAAKKEKPVKEAKPKPNFSTEKFVNVDDGKPLSVPVAALHIEVFQNGKDEMGISVKGEGSRNHIREALVKTMKESEAYFELFMECCAIAMIDKAESIAKKKTKKAKKEPKKSEKSTKAVSKNPAKKK